MSFTRVIDTTRQQAPAPKTPGLYKKREPIYPKLVHGRFRAIKWALLIATLAIYYGTPWIRWPRGAGLPQQAVLVDFPHGRFYFFFIQLWAEEVYYITGLLVIAALSLFLVTALFGRLWCGYTCPQTVWTDLYIAVERLFEGDRNARMRLDKAPLSLDKAWRKGGKHLTWIAIAAVTGGAWVFYFHDAPGLWRDLWHGQAQATSYLWIGLLTLSTYALAGMMREQVCTYMCPWPRIQGAMIDSNTLQVTYRYDRGETRGPHKKGDSWEGRGDCIDCNQCVVVCPMGIDIRDGLQLECINCALCIDACDEVMVKVGRPTGLIGFDADAAVATRAEGKKPAYRFVRGRTIYYAVALSIVAAVMVWGLATRATLSLDALHDRNPLFVRLKDGSVRNGYTLKLSNRGVQPARYSVTLEGLPSARVNAIGLSGAGALIIPVEPSQVRTLRLFVTESAKQLTGPSQNAVLVTRDLKSGETRRTPTVFLSDSEVRP